MLSCSNGVCFRKKLMSGCSSDSEDWFRKDENEIYVFSEKFGSGKG